MNQCELIDDIYDIYFYGPITEAIAILAAKDEAASEKHTRGRLRILEHVNERSEQHDKHGKIAEKRGRRNSH